MSPAVASVTLRVKRIGLVLRAPIQMMAFLQPEGASCSRFFVTEGCAAILPVSRFRIG